MAPKLSVMKRPATMKKPAASNDTTMKKPAASKSMPLESEMGAESLVEREIQQDLCIVARYKPGGKVYVIPSGPLLVCNGPHNT